MDRPVRFLLLLGAVFFGRSAMGAAEAVPTVEPVESAAAPKRERAISPRMAALLTAATPKFEAPKPAEAKPAAVARDKPANEIIRLPDYIVREPLLPTSQQVMTRKAIESYAMNRYLGPENGLDRGFLNLFTIAQFWRMIPLIGRFIPAPFGSMTNEERAMMYYAEDERKQQMSELRDFASLARMTDSASANDKLKREIDKTFMHERDFGR